MCVLFPGIKESADGYYDIWPHGHQDLFLIGTWADATWAIDFYKKHGFHLVSYEEKEQLLRKYWKIPVRQIETSVVLASSNWTSSN